MPRSEFHILSRVRQVGQESVQGETDMLPLGARLLALPSFRGVDRVAALRPGYAVDFVWGRFLCAARVASHAGALQRPFGHAGDASAYEAFLGASWQENGQLPRWCPYSFGGIPFLSDVQVAAFYPLHAPLLWLPEESVGTAMSWLVLLHVIIAGLSMYAYARHRGLTIAGGLAAALIFMFAGKWLLHILVAGHYIMIPLAWLPLVLLFFERSLTRRGLPDAVYAGTLLR